MEAIATKLLYHEDMSILHSTATFLSFFKGEDGRLALVLHATVFHPQGGGQPSDTGHISNPASHFRFLVQDVRIRDGGVVLHYGCFEDPEGGWESRLQRGQEVSLYVDAERRDLNSRLHSAGHLLDICMANVGLSHLEPGKGYHFPDGPFVEYRGSVPQDQLKTKQKELEEQANALIARGGRVSAAVLVYEEASKLCGGTLPDYIQKESTPRIVRLGDHIGCPCGGTHVADISYIKSLKVTQIRVKKGLTKVFYKLDPC